MSHEHDAPSMYTAPPSESSVRSPEIARPTSVHNLNDSRVDSPYINARSPSGHLIPYSPTPARRYSRDNTSWMTGSRASFHDEPSPIGSLLQTNSSTTIHSRQFGPDVVQMSPRDPALNSSPRSTHTHLSADRLEHHRNTPYSIKSSSQLSVSQRSIKSGSSGRLSYREHHGPTARARTPASERIAPDIASPSSHTLERAELGGSANFARLIAQPSEDDPNRPGEPILSGHRFYPMSVSGILRYYDNRAIRPLSKNDYKIEAMMFEYPKTPEVPLGWTACRHPEGALYFVHDESKTFTEVNIRDEDVHGDIEYFREFLISELKKEINEKNLSGSLKVNEIELVLEPKVDRQGVMCCYYFVYPPTRSLFWLDGWEGDEIFKDCKGELSEPHKGLAIQAQYWNHWDLFPNFCKITQDLKDEVVDMILHATCDHLTSNTSTCPFSLEELKNHLAVVDRIDPEKTGKRGHTVVVTGRIMHTFYHAYFMNYYGEDCARLNFDQTIHDWRYHASLFMTIFAPLLFMVPVKNVQVLHRIFVDDIASKERWNMFLTRLHSHFQATSVLATVLLNANVGLLAKLPTDGFAEQYLCYMSLVASMASIILGLVFMGTTRIEEKIDPLKAATFLSRLRHKRHGLETLAIIYSLPNAFLMWGMLLFFAAFAVQWYYAGTTIMRACAGGFILGVALLIAWSIWTAQDPSDAWWFQLDPYRQKQRGEQEEGGFFTRLKKSLSRNFVSQFFPEESWHTRNN